MPTLVFWGFQRLSGAKNCLPAKSDLKTNCSKQMIKERWKGSRSLRLLFLGFFLSDSFSGTIFFFSLSTPPGQILPPALSSSFPSIPPTPPMYPQFPHKNTLAELPFFSETCPTSFSSELVKTCPFKSKPGFPGGAVVENLPANAGDTGSSPGLGRFHMPRSN